MWKILLAALVVLVLLVVYAAVAKPAWGHLEYWRMHLFEKPAKVYERSAGHFDEAARVALRRLEATPAPTPETHRLAAEILMNNVIAQGEGTPEVHDRARRHWADALALLTAPLVLANVAGRATRRRRGVLTDEDATPETVIDGAFNFAMGGGGIAAAAEERQAQAIAARREVAAAAGGRAAKAAAYVDLAQQNTSDTQNSHDVSVNGAKRRIVAALRADQASLKLPSLDEVTDELRARGPAFSRDPHSGSPRPAIVTQALDVVMRARNGEFSMAAEATDAEVLQRVWLRTKDPRNKANRRKLQQSVFDALADCWERGTGHDEMQCVDGRISRLLGSLALLDHDAGTWDIRRLEQHKNDIFEKTKKVIDRMARAAAEQDEDAELKKVGRSYTAATAQELAAVGATDDKVEEEFKGRLREAIRQMVDAYDRDHPAAIPRRSLEGIKKEAVAAVM